MAKCSPARKARIRARNQAHAVEVRAQCATLKAAGKSCATCQHFDRPFSMQPKAVCQLTSDFQGYTITTPDNVCPDFKANI